MAAAPRVAEVLTAAVVAYLVDCHLAEEALPAEAGATAGMTGVTTESVAHHLAAVPLGLQVVVVAAVAMMATIPLEQDCRALRHLPTATEAGTDGAVVVVMVIARQATTALRLGLTPRHADRGEPQRRRRWETSELRSFRTILRALCVGERDSTTPSSSVQTGWTIRL